MIKSASTDLKRKRVFIVPSPPGDILEVPGTPPVDPPGFGHNEPKEVEDPIEDSEEDNPDKEGGDQPPAKSGKLEPRDDLSEAEDVQPPYLIPCHCPRLEECGVFKMKCRINRDPAMFGIPVFVYCPGCYDSYVKGIWRSNVHL